MRSLILTVLVSSCSFGHLLGGPTERTNESEREARIRELRNTINDQQLKQRDPQVVILAIEQLGQLGAVSAIDDLARLIGFRRTFEWEHLTHGKIVYSQPPHLMSALDYYPAAGALSAIGAPALPALIRLIERNPIDSTEYTNAYQTIVLMLRNDPEQRVKLFRVALAKASSEPARQRLSEALERVKALR